MSHLCLTRSTSVVVVNQQAGKLASKYQSYVRGVPHLPLLDEVVLAHRLEGEHALLARRTVAMQREPHIAERADAEDRAQLEIVEAEALLGSQ
jgi:hypothetical protein